MFEHAERIRQLLAEGKAAEARARHNARVDAEFAEFDRARAGATINLSDLVAAKEELHIDEIERGGAASPARPS